MSNIFEYLDEREEWISERYELIRGRMENVSTEDMKELFQGDFLSETALFLVDCMRVQDLKEAHIYDELSDSECRAIDEQLFVRENRIRQLQDRMNRSPELSYSWRVVMYLCMKLMLACKDFDKPEDKLYLTIHAELFMQIFSVIEENAPGGDSDKQIMFAIRELLYYHISDYCDLALPNIYRRYAHAVSDFSGGEREADLWELLITGQEPEVAAFLFDKAMKERFLSEEKSAFEEWEAALQQEENQRQFIEKLVCTKPLKDRMEFSNKNWVVYKKYLEEVYEFRKSRLGLLT